MEWAELHQGTLSGISVPLPLPIPHTVPPWILWYVSQGPHCSIRGTLLGGRGWEMCRKGHFGSPKGRGGGLAPWLSAFAAEPQIPPPDPNPRGPPSFTQSFLYPPPHLLPIPPMQVWDILLPPKSLPRSEVHSPNPYLAYWVISVSCLDRDWHSKLSMLGRHKWHVLLPPQGLCTCNSCYLKCSLPRCLHDLLPHFILFKWAFPPFCLFSLDINQEFVLFTSWHYIFICMSVYFFFPPPPLECKFLVYVESPALKTMPSIFF